MSNGNYENGRLPDSALAPIAQGRLVKDNYCAASWNAMNVKARSQGLELTPTGSMSSYRTYDQQVYLYEQYLNGTGALAAVPGTSNHGWGLAVDVATQEMRSMIDRIGHEFGWAKEWSDAQSEWWHLKYRAGVWSGSDPGPSGSGGGGPAPTEEDTEMITSAVSDGGTLHVWWVVGDGQTVRYRYQRSGSSDWQDGGVFTKAPKQIAGLSATLTNTGTLEVFVRYSDGNVSHCWQKKGSTSWSGGAPGKQIAEFTPLPA